MDNSNAFDRVDHNVFVVKLLAAEPGIDFNWKFALYFICQAFLDTYMGIRIDFR